jgi:GNAT superfamily N-acetyltransferase
MGFNSCGVPSRGKILMAMNDCGWAITDATLDDIPALCELLTRLFTQEADFVPDVQKQAQGLRLIISEPARGQLFALRVRGKVVGMVSLLRTVSTAEGSEVFWLEDMIVADEFCGKGFGTELLRHAIEYARRQRIPRITLLTDLGNKSAQGFYQRHGFKASAMTPMRLLLEP